MPSATELNNYYKARTDQELLNLRREGGFTAEAEQVLVKEMARRNLGVTAGDLTFGEFAAWLREYWSVPVRRAIVPETQFERNLGLAGDHGNNLLVAAEKEFEVKLGDEETGVSETFNL